MNDRAEGGASQPSDGVRGGHDGTDRPTLARIRETHQVPGASERGFEQCLDGYIAGPHGEFDWIVADPEVDFVAMYAGFSGLVMGRRSYEVFVATGGAVGPALPTYVYSRHLPEGERDGVTFVRDAVAHVRALKRVADPKPLWLWGGGDLFRQHSPQVI